MKAKNVEMSLKAIFSNKNVTEEVKEEISKEIVKAGDNLTRLAKSDALTQEKFSEVVGNLLEKHPELERIDMTSSYDKQARIAIAIGLSIMLAPAVITLLYYGTKAIKDEIEWKNLQKSKENMIEVEANEVEEE